MKQFRSYTRWTGMGLVLLLSPAIVVFGAPLGYGILVDLLATAWLAPVALMLAAAIAFNAMRRGALQAAKSIT